MVLVDVPTPEKGSQRVDHGMSFTEAKDTLLKWSLGFIAGIGLVILSLVVGIYKNQSDQGVLLATFIEKHSTLEKTVSEMKKTQDAYLQKEIEDVKARK